MPIAPVVIPAVAVPVIVGSTTVGSLASWCADNPSGTGCVGKKGSVIDTGSIPVMQLFDGQATGPCNVPMYNFALCHDQLQGITVDTSIPGVGGKSSLLKSCTAKNLTAGCLLIDGQFDNVPPACMDLAGVLSGSCDDQSPRPTPCGSACLLYTGLTDDHYATISNAMGG